jgi:uncharacterized LabA/DUF88 family protein
MAGFSCPGRLVVTRVVVFIDYQNAYRGARRAFFHEWDPGILGHLQPRLLALKLKGGENANRELTAVRVYRGIPIPKWDPVGAAAADRQAGLWNNQGLVTAITRPLNYRDPHDPREKGIDVSLAVDFVMMAQRGEYDVGILFSEDTDLVPALEAVAEIKGPAACETGTWFPLEEPGRRPPSPLLLPHARLGAVHLLRKSDFDHVRDNTDYNARRRRR